MLSDDLEGRDGEGGREVQGVMIHVYLWLIHCVVKQKLMQHCKATTPQ